MYEIVFEKLITADKWMLKTIKARFYYLMKWNAGVWKMNTIGALFSL